MGYLYRSQNLGSRTKLRARSYPLQERENKKLIPNVPKHAGGEQSPGGGVVAVPRSRRIGLSPFEPLDIGVAHRRQVCIERVNWRVRNA